MASSYSNPTFMDFTNLRGSTGQMDENDLIPKSKLVPFLQTLAVNEKFDSEALALLSQIGEEFVTQIIDEACQLASLKEPKNLSSSDITFVLETMHDIHLPPAEPPADMKIRSTAAPQLSNGQDVHVKRLVQIRQHQFASHFSSTSNVGTSKMHVDKL